MKFIFHWLTGQTEEAHGENVADALQALGHGNEAINALDYYEHEPDTKKRGKKTKKRGGK